MVRIDHREHEHRQICIEHEEACGELQVGSVAQKGKQDNRIGKDYNQADGGGRHGFVGEEQEDAVKRAEDNPHKEVKGNKDSFPLFLWVLPQLLWHEHIQDPNHHLVDVVAAVIQKAPKSSPHSGSCKTVRRAENESITDRAEQIGYWWRWACQAGSG